MEKPLNIILLLAAGAFAIYEGLQCSYHADRTIEEMRGLSDALKERDRVVQEWVKTQDRIHEDQMKTLKRIEALE